MNICNDPKEIPMFLTCTSIQTTIYWFKANMRGVTSFRYRPTASSYYYEVNCNYDEANKKLVLSITLPKESEIDKPFRQYHVALYLTTSVMRYRYPVMHFDCKENETATKTYEHVLTNNEELYFGISLDQETL